MIPFNRATITDLEKKYVLEALSSSHLSGDGSFTFRVYEKCREILGLEKMLLTTSGTTALEMAAILLDLTPEDEVIVPSFTFSSTANAFLLRGARPVFCDIRPDTMNMDETLVEGLITEKTKAIYTVDYAGVPCEMDVIEAVARKHGIPIVEDSAQAFGSFYKGRAAGTLGTFGCYSFHETKNYSMGEGGAIVLNDESYEDRAEIIREKGTNRRQVLKGMTDKYTWHDVGSSFLPSDVLAAMLYAQLERFDEIKTRRVAIWNGYHEQLKDIEQKGLLRRAVVPSDCEHNGHMYNILLPDAKARDRLVAGLREKEIYAYICYVPLHSAPMGAKLGYRPETCPVTEDYGQRILRLPLYMEMTDTDVTRVCEEIGRILG